MSLFKKWRRRWRQKNSFGKDIDRKRPQRHDLKRFCIGNDVYLDVFWKNLKIGTGSALSVYVSGHEAIKFDCFGPRDGHFHVDFVEPKKLTPQQGRLFFREATVEDQIERTLFELEYNTCYYLARHPNRLVRSCEFDTQTIRELAPELRSLMLEYNQIATAKTTQD